MKSLTVFVAIFGLALSGMKILLLATSFHQIYENFVSLIKLYCNNAEMVFFGCCILTEIKLANKRKGKVMSRTFA